jgi:lipid II:glycine glycyltransferase (peptidoglycan interpeptide bridge formation enzyme)
MTYTKILNTKPDNWDTLVQHPLQAWEWGDFRISMGIDVVRIGLFKKNTKVITDEPYQVYQLTFHKLPSLPFTIGYFPKGPPPNEEMLQTLRELSTTKRAIFVQLEPNCVVDSNMVLK